MARATVMKLPSPTVPSIFLLCLSRRIPSDIFFRFYNRPKCSPTLGTLLIPKCILVTLETIFYFQAIFIERHILLVTFRFFRKGCNICKKSFERATPCMFSKYV